MEKEEIEFFREKLKAIYDMITDKLLADKREADSKVDKTKISDVRITHKGMNVFKSILKLGLKIVYMNKVSDNVTEADFKYEIEDLFNAAKGGKIDGNSVINGNYLYQSECFEYIIQIFTKMRLLLKNDDDLIKFVNGMAEALDICEWNNYSDYITALMFLFKSGLISRKDYARLAVVDDIHTEYPNILKAYKLGVPVLNTFKNNFAEYEIQFNKKYDNSAKKK